MTDKKHTPEPWRVFHDSHIESEETKTAICRFFDRREHDYPNHIANAARIVECVNALAGIDNPAEWVEKMKKLELELTLRSDFKIQDLHILINERDNIKREYVALIQNYEELQAENERLKKEIAEWELFAKAANESIKERNKSIAQLKKTAQRLFNYMSEKHGVTLLETDMQDIERILSPSPMEEIPNEPFTPHKPWNPVQPTPLKGWIKISRNNYTKELWASSIMDTKPNLDKKSVAIIDLSKHYEGEGL